MNLPCMEICSVGKLMELQVETDPWSLRLKWNRRWTVKASAQQIELGQSVSCPQQLFSFSFRSTQADPSKT